MTDNVRWGILSTAAIAQGAFIPAVRQTDRGQIVAVASRDQERARAFAREHQIQQAFESYEAMLASGDIDAVYNPLPNSMHAEWTLKAAERGKHVFCEKPLAASAAEARKMVTACRQAGVLLFEAFVFLYHPKSLKLRQLLDDGAVGALTQLQMSFTFHLKRPTDNIRMNKELAGGSLMDVGCYVITYARFVFGEEPLTVQAEVRMDPDYGVDTLASMVLRFSGDRFASLQAGFEAPGGQHATIHGSSGYVAVPRPCHPKEQDEFTVYADGQTDVVQVDAGVRPFTPAVQHFQDCVLDGGRPMATAEGAAGTLRVIEAVRESSSTGRRIELS